MTAIDADDLSSVPRADRIGIRATQMLLRTGPVSTAMHILVACVLAWVLRAAHPLHLILPWLFSLSACVLFQAWLVRRHGGDRFDPRRADRLLRLFTLAALGVGLSWGFAGWFLFPAGDPGRQIFLTFVMGGMAMSAVSNQHVRMQACIASVAPGMLPLAFRYMAEPGELSLVYGGLLAGYTLVLMTVMVRQWRFSTMAFRLQLENEDLLEDVSRQALELDAARREAEAANAAKSRFLAQASHDLRQPLHAISLYVEALPARTGDEESGRIIGRVRQSLDVLSRLFNSLLDITLLDTGQIEVRPVTFRPAELFEQIRDEFAGLAEAAGVEIRISAGRHAVRADPVLLRRVLQNLCSNALRHADGGRILLALRRRGEDAAIEVHDDGAGIPADEQARIFEEFTRLDPARMGQAAAPGLGLGLAIVKRLSDVMGLKVELRSAPGRGSRFRIAGLPLADAATAGSLLEDGATEPEDALSGARILLIDDDADTLAAGAELLGRWGCQVDMVQAWTGPPADPPDIIICDHELSAGFTGFDALDEIEAAAGGLPPTILISGDSSPDLRKRARERGLPLIHKPVRPGQLRSALLHVTTRSHQSA